MTARIARAALRLMLTVTLIFTLAPVVLSAREVRVAPKIYLPRGLDTTRTVYVELSITDGTQSYMNRGQIDPGSWQTTIKLKGVPYDRNYIVVARASNTSNFSGETVILRAVVRKSEVAEGTSECPVELRNASTVIANAVLLYLQNTALSLNEIDASRSSRVEDALNAILLASDPNAEAESLSTVTVTGTATDVLGDPLQGITVAAVDCTPSALTLADGAFTLPKVPVRCTSLLAQHVVVAPQVSRYVSKTHALSPLSPGGPATAGTISLDPDPQAIRGDLGTALSLMADNTGDLAEWLSESFGFNRAVPVELQPPDSQTLNKAAFVLEIPPEYVEISVGSDFVKTETGVRTYSFNSTWTGRHAGTLWREKSAASGTIVYGNRRWQLSSLTLANPVILPRPPAGLTAAGGDGRAILSWQAPADMDGITGFRIFRSQSAETIPIEPIPGTMAANARTYTDTNLSTGTYYYWICSVEQYGAQIVRGPLAPMATAQVYNSRDTINQFLDCAIIRDQAGMLALLDDSFSTYLAGDTKTKFEFVQWVLETLFPPSDPVGGPAHEWRVDAEISRSVQELDSELRLKTYMVGRLAQDVTGYSRWVEGTQGWRVLATGQHLISWFGAGSRVYYPASVRPECTNLPTVDKDGFAALEWSAPEGDPDPTSISGYYILRSETNDWAGAVRFPQTGLLPKTQITYADSTIVSGTAYYYWVIVVDGYGIESKRAENMDDFVMVAGLPPDVRAIAEQFLLGSSNKTAATVLEVTSDDCRVYQSDGLGHTWVEQIAEYVKFTNFSLDPGFTYHAFHEVRNSQTGEVSYYEITFDCEGTWDGIGFGTVTITVEPSLDGWVVTLASYRPAE